MEIGLIDFNGAPSQTECDENDDGFEGKTPRGSFTIVGFHFGAHKQLQSNRFALDTIVPTTLCNVSYPVVSVRTGLAGRGTVHSLHPANLACLVDNTR